MTARANLVNKKNYRYGHNSRGLTSITPAKNITASVIKDPIFQASCKVADVEPTNRQASKFRNKQGAAYAARVTFGGQGVLDEAGMTAHPENTESI